VFYPPPQGFIFFCRSPRVPPARTEPPAPPPTQRPTQTRPANSRPYSPHAPSEPLWSRLAPRLGGVMGLRWGGATPSPIPPKPTQHPRREPTRPRPPGPRETGPPTTPAPSAASSPAPEGRPPRPGRLPRTGFGVGGVVAERQEHMGLFGFRSYASFVVVVSF